MNLFKNTFRRGSLRLRHWDYSQTGWYFVTICTKDREEHFGEIRNGITGLSEIGNTAVCCWQKIPRHYPNVELEEFVIMPNHVHGIIVIDGRHSVRRDVALQRLYTGGHKHQSSISPKPGSLSAVIRSYKSACTNEIHKFRKMDFFWQPNYYEHIIRNKQSLERIREYIHNNPLKWEFDIENKKCATPDKKYYEKIFDDP